MLGQSAVQQVLDVPALRTAATVFVAICIQALPFLVLGVLLSGAITAFLPAHVLRRVLPSGENRAVGVAGLAGVGLPTCECASVPVARRLIGQGVPASVALTFMNAAPAVNPVVLVATAVAFPGEPGMVLARFLGSLATAMVLGWLWARWGKTEWIIERARRRVAGVQPGNRWRTFTETARGDLVDAGGFLVLGAGVAAAMNVLIPAEWYGTLSEQLLLAVVVMALLAVVLALCSEADAFVVASLPGVPLPAKLVFLVVGPVVDAKLIMLYSGTFGRSFAVRFVPVAFVVAVACGLAAALLVLGGGGR
ncbi:permease [Haloechinothrix sp. LS1_15]|nr:permease [Haloechinothrix sp. LS1_15]